MTRTRTSGSSLRRFAARLLLVAAGAALPLAALEAALRLEAHLHPPDLESAQRFARRPTDAKTVLRLVDLVRVADREDIVYELAPGVSGIFRGVPVQINAHGMRDEPVSPSRPPGGLRIALLGDSIAFGWGVRAEDSFGERLEAALQKELGRPVEVLNFAVPGYNTAIEAAVYEHRARRFSPDLVLLQYFHNDLYLPNFLLVRPPPPRLYVLDWLLAKLRDATPPRAELTFPRRAGDRGLAIDPWKRDPRLVPPKYRHMVGERGVERALERLARATRADGVPVLFARYALPGRAAFERGRLEPGDTPDDRFALDRARRLGFAVVDLAPLLFERMRRRRLTNLQVVRDVRDDWHPNALGHALVADALLDALRSEGLVPARRG